MSAHVWWRNGVVYQIYPRSFMDASGDGVGDLEGIRRRLDHLAWLGVDAVWLSPIFPSPMADFGYDVADYCDVDPLFGSLDDLDRLLADAHARGIRLILDWVPNHTSDRHPWFEESRAGRASARRDWYVWRDAGPDGGPPNNWLSIFGGPAWQWDEATRQFYLHSFLVEQPDLDWRNPAVETAMHDVARFWLERGVDGFRIDVIHRIAKDAALRDNPILPGREGQGYGGQQHLHDENHPDIHVMLRRLRAVLEEYEERMMVGEVYLFDPAEVARYHGDDDELQLAFNFSFMHGAFEAARFRAEVERMEALLGPRGWPSWVLSNHDQPRHATRYDDPELGEARARVAAMLLLTLRGTPFLYYGEEIGLRNVPVPVERMQDPLARTLHPNLCRDGERTPIPWEPGPGHGFTTGPEPWLPFGDDADERNVARQRGDRASLLWLYKDLLALRRAQPALHGGSFRALDSTDGVFAFERRSGSERCLVALNLGDGPAHPGLPAAAVRGGLATRYGAALPAQAQALELGPAEGAVLIVD